MLLVSGVACMTVLCGSACGGGEPVTAAQALPPCHAGAVPEAPGPAGVPAPCPEGGLVCCSTWIAEPADAIAPPSLARTVLPLDVAIDPAWALLSPAPVLVSTASRFDEIRPPAPNLSSSLSSRAPPA